MIPDFSPSMFIGVMGGNIISFGSGQPDLPPPKEAFDALSGYRGFKYDLVQGSIRLREALSKKNKGFAPEDFVIGNGASESMDLLLRTLFYRCGRKGNVLLTRPYYYSYPHVVKFSGFGTVYTDLVGGRIDFEDFEEKVRKCKVAVINSPSNPTGMIEPRKTLKKIEKLTRDLGVYVISDDVYDEMVYAEDAYFMKGPNIITLNSFSKTYSMCGFRVGYSQTIDSELNKSMVEMKSHTSMNTSIIAQEMALAALNSPRKYITDCMKVWRGRRDAIYRRLTDMGLELKVPEGAFYVLPAIKHAKEFVWNMYEKHDLITYLGDWFGAPDHVRFSYPLDVEKIEEGMDRVEKFLKENPKYL